MNDVNVYQRATTHDFREGLKRYYGNLNGWSYEGTKVMFEYLEELADDCGTPLELDAVAICGDFSEYTVKDYIEEGLSIDEGCTGHSIPDDVLIAWIVEGHSFIARNI